LSLTTLVAFLFRQAARLDQARRVELVRLQEAALVDSLTGLRNHRAFQEDLMYELERQNRTGAPLSLVLLDLDGLKRSMIPLGIRLVTRC
jgi:PleD family two-component response regulator